MKPFLLVLAALLCFSAAEAQVPLDSMIRTAKSIPFSRKRADTYLYIAQQLSKSYPDSAMGFLNRAIYVSDSLHYEQGFMQIAYTQGMIHYYRGDLDQAFGSYLQALNAATKADNKEYASRCYNNISIVCIERTDFACALDHMQRSLAIKQALGDSSGLGVTYLNMAELSTELKDSATAFTYLTQAVGILERLGMQRETATAYLNMGELIQRTDSTRALGYIIKAAMTGRAINDPTIISAAYFKIGQLHARRSNWPVAQENFQKALDIQLSQGKKRNITDTRLGLGEVLLKQGKSKEALNTLQAAFADAEQLQIPSLTVTCCRLLADTYTLLGDTQRTLYYQGLAAETEAAIARAQRDARGKK